MPEIKGYRFADCWIDLSTRELRRGDELVAIEPKAHDLLVFLLQNRERAVDKNELQDEIWRGTIVTEAALTRCVMKARRAIGDDGDTPEMIKTIRGHGYRFLADVIEERESDLATGSALPLPDKPSIAVLPFANRSNDAEQEYFSDGITDDIITELSRFGSLFVIASHSAFAFKGQARGISDIAADLGVAYVVEGSVQRSGNRLRMNVRLIDAQNDIRLWSERFDRDIEDVLLVQDELASTIAATVGGRVEATRGRRKLNAAGVESYDCLLRALALYYKVSLEDNNEARQVLQQALEIEPDNPRALILLAAVESMASWSFWAEDNEASRQLSRTLGRRSIELDDGDSLAHALFAEILFDCGEREQAEHHFQRAISLNPNDIAARALYGSKLSAQGRVAEAEEQLAIGERLDPFGLVWIPWIKGNVKFNARKYEEALTALTSMQDPPNEANYVLAACHGRLGRREEGRAYVDRFLERARLEMPTYPGERLQDWQPILGRMLDYDSTENLDHLIESLRMAGWE